MNLGFSSERYQDINKDLDVIIDYLNDSKSLFRHTYNNFDMLVEYFDSRVVFLFQENKKDKFYCLVDKRNRNFSIHYMVEEDNIWILEYQGMLNSKKVSYVLSNDSEGDEDGRVLLGKKYNVFKELMSRNSIVTEILEKLPETLNNKKINEFLSYINNDNAKLYLNLIKKCNKNIEGLISINKESISNNMDIFNLSKEDKDLINLKLDIDVDKVMNKKKKLIEYLKIK